MKTSLIDQLKELITLAKRYLKLQTECVKLQAAEKSVILISALTIGFICILLGALIVVLLSMAAVCAFGAFLEPWLAYLCVAGIILFLAILIVLLRKPLIINPISRMITKLICPKKD